MNMNNTASEAVKDAVRRNAAVQAKYIAESGVNITLTNLKSDPYWRGEKTDISVAGGSLDIFVSDRADISGNAVEVKSFGVFEGVVDSAGVILEVLPVSDRFSRFSYFSNRENNIWFYSADTLYGPVHTNGRFNMTGSPVFFGLVSSESPSYNTMGAADPQFLGGTDLGRDRIDLEPDFYDLRNAAFNGGHLVLNNSLFLKFQSNGTYQYKIGASGSWQSRAIPDNGVIASNRAIYIEGTLNGQVTIGTTRSIYITGDIIYADDPLINPDSDDLLGLAAYNNIVVKNNTANRNGCRIYAAILAKEGSFKAENIYFYPTARLELFGGIVQEIRGAVGRLGSPPTGFEKYYQYDERMEFLYPPYYPIAPGSIVNLNQKAKITIQYWK